jgi:hypothetical protein
MATVIKSLSLDEFNYIHAIRLKTCDPLIIDYSRWESELYM